MSPGGGIKRPPSELHKHWGSGHRGPPCQLRSHPPRQARIRVPSAGRRLGDASGTPLQGATPRPERSSARTGMLLSLLRRSKPRWLGTPATTELEYANAGANSLWRRPSRTAARCLPRELGVLGDLRFGFDAVASTAGTACRARRSINSGSRRRLRGCRLLPAHS